MDTTLNLPEKNSLIHVLKFLKKNNLLEAETALRKETNFYDSVDNLESANNSWSVYRNESNPNLYRDAYKQFQNFLDKTLDTYKHELGTLCYPLFAHMYLELVYNNHEEEAKQFAAEFGKDQESFYQCDIVKLSAVTKLNQLKGNDVIDAIRSSQFTVRLSRDAYSIFKKYIEDKKVLQNIIHEHLCLDVYEGIQRNKLQIDLTAGAMMGEAERQINKIKIFYGLLREPDIQISIDDDDELSEIDGDKPKKKKLKKDLLVSKKSKNDPNAPPLHRFPLPDLRDGDKLDKIRALRESVKRVALGSDSLPSICFYTMLNSSDLISAVEISEDSSMIAVGFADSQIKVWSLLPQNLKGMKSAEELNDIDKEAEDVLARMLDEKSAESCKSLYGHSGPVYCVSFSPDRTMLLSCSEDGNIRLWSFLTWTCLVCYKGHIHPVWKVKFSPYGYYFATCAHDRTARLWTTDSNQPLRSFAGHMADVDCIQFHPNSNYLATGSSDRTIRLWDCVTGQCVRLLTGHKGSIHSLAFSICGRLLVSGSLDTNILVWDLANGQLLSLLTGHTNNVISLAMSKDGNILASGGLDCSIKLWDFTHLIEDINLDEVNLSQPVEIQQNNERLLLKTFYTKNSPILELHFTRRNLILAAGPFQG